MAKEYPAILKNEVYQEFWDDIKKQTKPPSRPVSAPRDSREQFDPEDTPRTKDRKKYSLLPKITKNTNVKKFDVDFSIIKEDPLFGDYRKNSIRRRLIPMDGVFTLKDITGPGGPSTILA